MSQPAVPVAILGFVVALGVADAAPAGARGPAVSVERAWVRPVPAGLTSTAAYFTIRNTGREPDTLEAVSSPVGRASMHESMQHDGMMMMRPAGPVAAPAQGVVAFQPGGRHVMIEGLKAPLPVGARVPLSFVFKRAGSITVQAEVRPSAP